MKKALFSLILLLLLGVTVFYFGWIQIRIPEHNYGVVFTKTRGYAPEIVRPGEFNWKVERLIPTNMKIHLFDLSPRSITVQVSGTLPSGELYAEAVQGRASFKYELELQLSYRIIPDQLPRLMKETALSPDTLEEWYTARDSGIIEAAADIAADTSSEKFSPESLSETLASDISSLYPELEILDARILSYSYPDYELYRTARTIFLERMTAVEGAETEIRELERKWIVSRKEKLAVLEEYGRLLSEYPGLLKLVMSGQSGAELDMPSLQELLSPEQASQ
jgi:hypothetical protein